MEIKEELFNLRNNIRKSMRGMVEEERSEAIELIQELTHRINELNEKDFTKTKESMEELKDRIKSSNKIIKEATSKLQATQNQREMASTILSTARDIISFAFPLI